MPQQARDAEFAPHAAIDLRDQNSMVPCARGARNRLHAGRLDPQQRPRPQGCGRRPRAAEEFLADILMLLSTGGDESRIVQNGWAGAELAKHLRASLRQELAAETAAQGLEGGTDAMSDEAVIRLALSCYLKDLELLTARDGA